MGHLGMAASISAIRRMVSTSTPYVTWASCPCVDTGGTPVLRRTPPSKPRGRGGVDRKYHLHYASHIVKLPGVAGRSKAKRRSGCPVSMSLEVFGDRWSLLIVRDMMVRGFRTFNEFQQSGEGIATNILSDRLRNLEASGIIQRKPEKTDRRKVNYRLTEKGIDLAPALLELLIWGARHERMEASGSAFEQMAKHRDKILEEVRRRWQERDPRPLQVNGRWILPN
jgi:DNA-binding HxlR family transcriptional regulator